ncbi:MAG: sigma-70 family RNA polymerase sigma factor [Nitrospina sp.]|jgi:RNA polymerase sigma-32 factor|nr:sigma-70 family RNA polymerase sigma factor [Nitrospina sp.]MBT6718283.1 sigma-70 family RNA polymerase sigma factor [Nitrospina sp.]
MNDKPEKVKSKKASLVPAVRQKGTLAPPDPFNAYLQEAKRYPLLTEEEEKELAIRLRETGDVDAAYQLTTANLMLVVKIAMTFKREWQNVMDLVQEGNVGLMKAVKNFDPFRGVRLSAYATWWIKSYILKYILDNWRLVRVGTTNSRRKLLFNLKKEKERLEREGFDPSTKLLAEHFGVDEGEIIDVEASIGAVDVSMDTPTRPDSTMTPAQSLSDGKSLEKRAEIDQFREILQQKIENFKTELNPGEIELLDKRILSESPQSLQEIGDQRGVTREAVRQAEQRLLKKFKIFIVEKMPEAADYFNN